MDDISDDAELFNPLWLWGCILAALVFLVLLALVHKSSRASEYAGLEDLARIPHQCIYRDELLHNGTTKTQEGQVYTLPLQHAEPWELARACQLVGQKPPETKPEPFSRAQLAQRQRAAAQQQLWLRTLTPSQTAQY